MKTIGIIPGYLVFFFLTAFIAFFSCKAREGKSLTFKEFPGIKLGFSTQNFLKALLLNVEGLTEVIEYASAEGYHFVEIRDQFVDLSIEDCKTLANVARAKNMEIIYVFNKNPLDPGFLSSFEKALANVLVFPGPGILRAMASKTEFDADPSKKGWTKDELADVARISDSCALICKSKNVRLVFENSNEAFFGDSSTYFGLADLLSGTGNTGLQLDIANLFRNTARTRPDPEKVIDYLPALGDRWVETHLKTVHDGEPQPVLTDNPIPVEKIIQLMGKQNVAYAALELNAVENKQECFDNHARSIQFLREKGLLRK